MAYSDIYLGTVHTPEPEDAWKRGFEAATRVIARHVAEQILDGRHLGVRIDRTSDAVELYAVEETLLERPVIAEGLAMFRAAAHQNPALWQRHGRPAEERAA